MAEIPGSWNPSEINLTKAKSVIQATKASGDLYRNGLGMIASENIVSPMVQKVVCSDLHGGMLKVCQVRDTTKVVMILTQLKV